MWQRIQTLYLLIALLLEILLLTGTAYEVADPHGMVSVGYWQLQSPYAAIILCILTLLTVLALTTYKHLIFQMRTASLSGLVALGIQIWFGWMYFSWDGPVFKWTVIFPLVTAICCFLAARGCFQDQLMVESSQRLRNRRK